MSDNPIYDFMNEEGMAYSLCQICDCRIERQEDARWLTSRRTEEGWSPMVCTECAAKHPDDASCAVEPPPELAAVVSASEEIDELQGRIRDLEREKIKAINKILDDEGCEVGTKIYHHSKLYIVTGRTIHNYQHKTVKVVMHPAKQDGTASKINATEMMWNYFLKLWRLQRADPLGYVERSERRVEEARRRRQERISDDQL